MVLDTDLRVNGLLGGPLKETKDEILFLKLALRGYDLSAPRDNEIYSKVISNQLPVTSLYWPLVTGNWLLITAYPHIRARSFHLESL